MEMIVHGRSQEDAIIRESIIGSDLIGDDYAALCREIIFLRATRGGMNITNVINTYLAEKEVAYRIALISAD